MKQVIQKLLCGIFLMMLITSGRSSNGCTILICQLEAGNNYTGNESDPFFASSDYKSLIQPDSLSALAKLSSLENLSGLNNLSQLNGLSDLGKLKSLEGLNSFKSLTGLKTWAPFTH